MTRRQGRAPKGAGRRADPASGRFHATSDDAATRRAGSDGAASLHRPAAGQPDDLLVERVRGAELRLRVRPGLFARRGLDAGTRLLLESVDLAGAAMVADLGCGAGAVGIACARLCPDATVHLLDVNLRAVEQAAANVRLNGLANAEARLSDLFSAVDDARYSHVLANAPAQLGNAFLAELVEASLAHLAPGGAVWLVVVRRLRPVVERALAAAGARVERIAHGHGHDVLKASPRRGRPATVAC